MPAPNTEQRAITVESIEACHAKKDGHPYWKILGKDVLDQLVRQYSELFGRASVEVCKEAVKEVDSSISSEELPDILK